MWARRIQMLYDPRDLVQELKDQGNTVRSDRGEYGNPFYWITLRDGTHWGLSDQDLYDLKEQGKLNAAGILAHDAEIKAER
jgi:hypothetical protein